MTDAGIKDRDAQMVLFQATLRLRDDPGRQLDFALA